VQRPELTKRVTQKLPLFQDLFEATAREYPASLALSQGDQQWTYAAVNAAANRLGRHLANIGVGPGSNVAVLLPPSFDWIVTILALWKLGAAYIPLDHGAQPNRNAALIADAGCLLIVTTRKILDVAPTGGPQLLCMEDVELHSGRGANNLPRRAHPGTPAYIIYTSGSTGKPKGVCVPQRGLANLALQAGELQVMGRESRTLQFSAPTFDASICEITTALGTGGCLCLLEDTVLRVPGPEFARMLDEQAITHAVLPPSFLDRMPLPTSAALQTITSAGEACSVALARRWSTHCRFINGYGPTEATVYTSGGRFSSHDDVVRLGRPLGNVQLYLLDGMAVAPHGSAGEIVIGGIGVAHGYVGLPARTALAFIPDPFGPLPGARLYRTGDYASSDERGELTFIGRRDREVKVRGVRINLDEVEAVLGGCPAVVQSAVVARSNGEGHYTQLVMYFVPAQDGAVVALRRYAAERLTKHQIPSLFIALDSLPVTKHGKVDRKALPAVTEALPDPARGLRVHSELEGRIGLVWRSVLGLPAIDPDQSFFEIGGNSLLLAQLQLKLREELDVHIPLVELFEHVTISKQAQRIGAKAATRPTSDNPVRRSSTEGDIAIVGMAGRFPDARSVAEFWNNLRDGVESLRELAPDELREHGIPDEWLQHPDYVARGALLDEIDCFDAAFFGVTPQEARDTDPQQRLLLEVSHAALEDAGYDPARCPGRIGVYAGAAENQYMLQQWRGGDGDLESDLASGLGGFVDFLATRVSYKLNLRGPSMSVQTACSTSLTALAVACDALRANRCDMALAGGVSLRIPQVSGYWYSEGVPVSRDGRCRPFDSSAGGTCFSAGVGMVLLKPLATALADNDHIYAVVRGIGINNDGADKMAFTAPSAVGQCAAVAEALADADISARDIGYVEAHATGTALGDPIEVRALTEVFRRHTQDVGFCALGSVKANIGHTNRASGVASLIKAALALHHKQLPPAINFEAPNPALELEQSPFFVPTTVRAWDSSSTRYAGVSSLGAGGTNVHVVLGEAPPRPTAPPYRAAQLFVVSGRTHQSLASNVSALSSAIDALPESSLADAAFTLQVGRASLAYRLAAVGCDRASVKLALAHASAQPARSHQRGPKVAFMFPGHGGQKPGIVAGLYASEPVFRRHIAMTAELLPPEVGGALLAVIRTATAETSTLLEQRPTLLPLMLFAVEYALAQLWISWGVKPDVVIGHSAGEFAAACVAGVFDLQGALTALRVRTDLMETTGSGAMLAARMGYEDAHRYLIDGVSLAAVNGPQQCVFSGAPAAIEHLQEQLRVKDIDHRLLATANKAGHSPLMEPVLAQFRAAISGIHMHEPRIGYISNLRGEYASTGLVTEPDYWVRQLREPVRFYDGLRCLLAEPSMAFVEVGPPGNLDRLVPAREQHVAVSSLPGRDATGSHVEHMLHGLGRLWTHGVEVDWNVFHAADSRSRISLPTYSFERVRYWREPTSPMQATKRNDARGRLRAPIRDWFYAPVWRPTVARVRDAGERRCLVFSDGGTLALEIIRRLGPEVRVVRAGADFSIDADGAFLARPEVRSDLRRIFEHLADGTWRPNSVAYLWSCLSEPHKAAALTMAFSSLVHLIEQLGRSGAAVDLTVVTQAARSVTGHEQLCPESAFAGGPCLVAPQEYSHISCRQVDIETSQGAVHPPQLADEICSELQHDEPGLVVAYRRRARYVLDYQGVTLDEPASDRLPIRDGGVYLVVGGTGHIGTGLSRWIAQRPNVRLAIVGRSSLAQEHWDELANGADARLALRARALKALHASCAGLRYYRADATSLNEMTEVVARIQHELGSLSAVISCVQHPQQNMQLPIASAEPELLETIVATRFKSASVLAAVLKGAPLDFVMLSSSMASVLGGSGLAAGAASDAFIAAFAQRAANTTGVRYMSVHWDSWRHPGEAQIEPELRSLAIRTEEGLEAAQRVVASYQLPQVAICTTALSARLEQHVRRPRTATRAATEVVREALGSYVAPRNVLEQRVVQLWEEVLGTTGIGVEDSFFEVGGDSLIASRLGRRIWSEFAVHVPLKELLAQPTVAALAEAIGKPAPGRGDARQTPYGSEAAGEQLG